MPFTPLHLGIGTICKATSKHQFSFMIFGGTQVLMDIEPLLGLYFGWMHLHLYTHNLIGAVIMGFWAIALGKPLSEWILKSLNYKYWSISWKITIISAFVGSFSHILLDALMHIDMYPFYPLSIKNGLLGLVSPAALHLFCISSILIFGLFCLIRHKYLCLFNKKD